MTSDEKRGKFLAQLRIDKGLTQQELGKMLHYTHTAVSKWERGLSFPTNPEVLKKMSEVFNVSLEELLYGERKNNKNIKKIKENFVNEYSNNYQRYKKRLSIILYVLLISIIFFFVAIYFIFIRKSISVYSINLDTENLNIENSTLIISNNLSILNFNKIIQQDEREISAVRLYYLTDEDEERLVFEGGNKNHYVEEQNGYGEYNLQELPNVRLYVEVRYEDGDKENYQLHLEKKYTNDNIFPKKAESISEPNTTTSLSIGKDEAEKRLLAEGFEYRRGWYEKDLDKNETIMAVDFDGFCVIHVFAENFSMELRCEDKQIFYDYYDENDELQLSSIETTEEIDCNKKKCKSAEDYAKYINYIKKLLK